MISASIAEASDTDSTAPRAGPAVEADAHSFVIRLWLEDLAPGAIGNKVRWRGHVTHVMSGERRHVEDWVSVIDFVFSHFEDADVQLPFYWRVWQWLHRFRR